MLSKKIRLRSCDGQDFVVEKTAAEMSQMIKHMIDDGCAIGAIPLPNVTGRILSKVIEYCKKHDIYSSITSMMFKNLEDFVAGASKFSEDRSTDKNLKTQTKRDEDLKKWDADFVKVDQATLFDLILAANYLHIESLLDLTTQRVMDMIMGKTPEEIRTMFNIVNEFTPEEEEEVRRENQWAFE